MKSRKSYTVKIDGNNSKVEYLHQQLSEIQKLSEFIFSMGESEWQYHMPIYQECQKRFPTLNSKVVMNFIRFHFTTPNWKLKPKNPPKASILIDYQSCGLKHDETTKLSNYWIRFHRINFPLFGRRRLEKISDENSLKMIQIFKRKNKLYCKLTVSKEICDQIASDEIPKTIGLDINAKKIVLGNNDFYSLKRHHHRKIEHRKHFPNNKKCEEKTKGELRASHKLRNYTKDTIHKLTTKIANNLQAQDTEVLVFEDLTNLRNSASKKLRTSKGKNVNYIVNTLPYRMFQNLLEYKCLDRGINVVYVDPAYTSKQCSRCGSLNTSRKQTLFKCEACNYSLDADLNGSRNIQERYFLPKCLTSESEALSPVKKVGSCVL